MKMFANHRSSASKAVLMFAVCAVLVVTLSAAWPSMKRPSQRRLPAQRIRPGMRRPNRESTDEAGEVGSTLKGRLMQLMCRVEYFPPPDEHLYCCLKRPECECPHRMGVCAEENAEPETPQEDDDDETYDYILNSKPGKVNCFMC